MTTVIYFRQWTSSPTGEKRCEAEPLAPRRAGEGGSGVAAPREWVTRTRFWPRNRVFRVDDALLSPEASTPGCFKPPAFTSITGRKKTVWWNVDCWELSGNQGVIVGIQDTKKKKRMKTRKAEPKNHFKLAVKTKTFSKIFRNFTTGHFWAFPLQKSTENLANFRCRGYWSCQSLQFSRIRTGCESHSGSTHQRLSNV